MIQDLLHSPEKLRPPLTYPEKKRCATVEEAVRNISLALRRVEQQEQARIAQVQAEKAQEAEKAQKQALAEIELFANTVSSQSMPETPREVMSKLTEADTTTNVRVDDEYLARRAVEEALL